MTAFASSRRLSGASVESPRGGRMRRAGVVLTAAALVLGLAACEPVRRSHGYAPRAEQVARVVVGSDTQAQVAEKLGRPPIVGAFDENVWVYVFRQTERTTFWNEHVLTQEAVVVAFSEAGVVEAVDRYGVEDGLIVDLVSRTTPTRGRRLNFLQQLFGNIGRFDAGDNRSGILRTPGRF